MIKNGVKRIDFKERFKGKTSHVGKDGMAGVVKQASLPITDLGDDATTRSFKLTGRHKRAISQDYSFNSELKHSNSPKEILRSENMKKRKI